MINHVQLLKAQKLKYINQRKRKTSCNENALLKKHVFEGWVQNAKMLALASEMHNLLSFEYSFEKTQINGDFSLSLNKSNNLETGIDFLSKMSQLGILF